MNISQMLKGKQMVIYETKKNQKKQTVFQVMIQIVLLTHKMGIIYNTSYQTQ